MKEFNPYAPPLADLDSPRAPGEVGVWRDGDLLVMSKDAELPDGCLKCNAPAGGWRLKRKLSWHPPAYYLLFFLHVVIYVIVALIVRNTATTFIPLCPEHRRRRRRFIGLAWVFSLLGITTLVLGILGASSLDGANGGALHPAVFPVLIFGGLALFVTGVIFAYLASRVAVPRKIDKRFVWLRKVSPDLLASLPPWRA